jgi:spermidine/putrescine transport system permease protein
VAGVGHAGNAVAAGVLRGSVLRDRGDRVGGTDPLFGSAVPVWNPMQWQFGDLSSVVQRAISGDLQPVFVRTFVYVAVALGLSIMIGYPVAYYVARHAGRRRNLLLALILAPWWINY